MSMNHEEPFACRNCGEKCTFIVWDSLNTMVPEAKEKLMTGELFQHKCPKCGTVANLVYDLLYHDMDNQTMIQLVTSGVNLRHYIDLFNTFAKQEIVPGLPKTGDDYRLRIVKTQDELREKANIFDLGLDDRVIEVMKAIIGSQLSKSESDFYIAEMLLEITGKPERFYIRLGNGRVGATEFPQELYDKLLKDFFSSSDDGKKEYLVDLAWGEYFINHLKG